MEYVAGTIGLLILALIVYLVRQGAQAEVREALKEAEAKALNKQLDAIEKENAETYTIEVEERASYESVDTRSAADRLNDALSGLRKKPNRPGKA